MRYRQALQLEYVAESGSRAANNSSTPSRMLWPGRDGVLGTLKQCSSPDGVHQARSVKVPPTSVPKLQLATMFRPYRKILLAGGALQLLGTSHQLKRRITAAVKRSIDSITLACGNAPK